MKEVAILLLLTLFVTSCGSSSSDVQTAAGGIWQSQMVGGIPPASGFSFVTQFTISGGGALSVASFQFLTTETNSCFPTNPIDGGSVTGTMILTVNTSTFQVTGPLTMNVVSGGNTLTLNGNVTGTENGATGTTLSDGLVTGNWTLTGSCAPTGTAPTGSFTMTQTSSD